MRYQKAVGKEAKTLFAFEHSVFKESDYPLSLRALRYHLAKEHIILCVDEEMIAGYILAFKHHSRYKIHSLAVSSDFQHRGIARHLIVLAEEEAKKAGCSTITLEVKSGNDAAIKLYKSCGYRIVRVLKEYYLDSSDGYYMQKRLDYGGTSF